MKSSLLSRSALLAVAAASFALAGCDSAKENATEDAAQTVRQGADAKADAIEATGAAMDAKTDGMDTPAENAMEGKAAAVRASGEAKADAMEDKADKQ